MLNRLRRHPIPIAAHFRHSLVLAYAFSRETLEPLVPPSLELDTHGEVAFAAAAFVQTERLRPAFLPAAFGLDFFLAGYRIFVRVAAQPSLRGLYILRSDADRRLIVVLGNALSQWLGAQTCRCLGPRALVLRLGPVRRRRCDARDRLLRRRRRLLLGAWESALRAVRLERPARGRRCARLERAL